MEIEVLEFQDSFDKCKCLRNRISPKKDPCYIYKQKSKSPLKDYMHALPLFPEHSGKCISYSMQKSPENKGPVRTMPETTDKEYNDDIYISPDSSPTASAKRKVHIGSQESGQCQMPAFPEIYDRQRFVW